MNVADPSGDASIPIVLALVDFYPPAYRAGGPTRSVPRIADQLHDEFEFLVLTRDRDLGGSARLAGVASDRWVERGSVRCLYLSARRRLTGGVVAVLRRTRHDILYLNSIFSLEFSLIPLLVRRLRLIPRHALVVAPRGELDDNALAIKGSRKALCLWFVRTFHLLDDVTWHAANDGEARAIGRRFGTTARVLVAADIPMRAGVAADPPPKRPGTLDVVFLGRISRIKNLDFAIATLMNVGGRVTFNVFGPIEDEAYWDECQRFSRQLPADVTFTYRGLVEPDGVLQVLGRYHLLFLPTRGESFGHVIVESLTAGCPVLISDQTPWHGLEARHAGWEYPLSRPDLFGATVVRCMNMAQDEFDRWSAGARGLGREIVDNPVRDAAYRLLFRAAMDPGLVASLPTQGSSP